MFAGDLEFRTFLTSKLLEALHSSGNAGQLDVGLLAASTFDLPEYRNQIINYLLNSEHFYNINKKEIYRIMVLILSKNMHKFPNKVTLHFLQTLQILLTNQSDSLSGDDLKKFLSLHRLIPVMHPPFIAMLMEAYQILKPHLNRSELNECNPFNLNISHMNLPEIKDDDVI